MRRKSLLTFRLFLTHLALAALLGQSASGSSAPAAGEQSDRGGASVIGITPRAEQETGLYRDSYALIVGESNYLAWPHLFGAERDTRDVAAVLNNQGFKVLVLSNATRAEILKAIDEFKSRNDRPSPSRFIFYFVGHGYTQNVKDRGEMGYIIPSDAPLPEKNPGGFTATAISMDEMATIARSLWPTHALFVFDSCFAGTIFTTVRGVPDSISTRTNQPVRFFITAGTEKQEVPDESIFRAGFVAALSGEADRLPKDGYVTGGELGEFLVDYVSKHSKGAQTPRYGKIKDSNLDKGDFVFVLTNNDHKEPFNLDAQYYPSGWMGDIVQAGGTGTLNITTEVTTIEGKSLAATRIDYKQGKGKGWAGVYWQHPDKNWGDEPGFSLAGYKRISFFAKGANGGEIVEFISGGIATKGKPYQDSYRKPLGKVVLKKEWTKYVIDLSDLSDQQLSSVIGAFEWGAIGGYDKEGRLVTYIADLKVE
jgi:hypothetical protein